MMNLELVTLEQAKKHLRLSGSHEDDDVRAKLRQAHGIIADYLSSTDTDWIAEVDAWTDETLPEDVRGAILLQFGELYRFRGDEVDQPKREPGCLSDTIRALLARKRQPVIS